MNKKFYHIVKLFFYQIYLVYRTLLAHLYQKVGYQMVILTFFLCSIISFYFDLKISEICATLYFSCGFGSKILVVWSNCVDRLILKKVISQLKGTIFIRNICHKIIHYFTL